MKHMRVFWTLLGTIALAIIALIIFIYLKFGFILGKVLSSKFGTKVKIEQITLKQPKIDISNFAIFNPPGYNLPLALKINNIDINAPFRNYFHQEIRVNSLNINNVEINIIFQGRQGSESNWSYLLGNLSEEPHDHKKHPDEIKQDTKGRYAVIELLTITNLRVNIITPGQRTQTKVFRNMQFRNVVTKRGDITRRISQVIIYHMIFNYRNIIKMPIEIGKEASGGIFSIFEKLAPFSTDSRNTN